MRQLPPHYICSVCGERGHNARRHRKKSEKDALADLNRAKVLASRGVILDGIPVVKGQTLEETKAIIQSGYGQWEGPRGFINFANDYWGWLGHTKPRLLTAMQEEMADFLQNGPEKIAILAPRGVGKSTLLGAFVTHALKKNREEKIMVISKSGAFARRWTGTVLRTIRRIEELKDLNPTENQEASIKSFDVAGSNASFHSSMAAFGIEEQTEGKRGSIVILDDVETKKNTRTQEARDLLFEYSADFRNLTVLGMAHRIIYIGTVHHSDTLYYKLPERGFTVRKWTIAYPSRALLPAVSSFLAPSITQAIALTPGVMTGGVDERIGKSTDPIRFTDKEIKDRIESGWANFMMQSMLTPLFGEQRCPLKLRNLVVLDRIDPLDAPLKIEHSNEITHRVPDINVTGFGSDCLYFPRFVSTERAPMPGVVMALDPSSTESEDDFTYAIVGCLNAQLFLMDLGTLRSTSPEDLTELAELCIKWRVNTVYDEVNYAGGMFRRLFSPILASVCEKAKPMPWKCGFDPKGYRRFSETKERIIVELLDELTSKHRLIVSREVIEKDRSYCRRDRSEKRSEPYRFVHQYVRVVPDVKDCLEHDDRLDAVAIAAHYWQSSLSKDRDRQISEDRFKRAKKDEDEFMKNASCVDGMLAKKKKPHRWTSWALRGA